MSISTCRSSGMPGSHGRFGGGGQPPKGAKEMYGKEGAPGGKEQYKARWRNFQGAGVSKKQEPPCGSWLLFSLKLPGL